MRKLPTNGPELMEMATLLGKPALPEPSKNWLGKEAALVLAELVRGYWLEKGRIIKTWVERVPGKDVWGIRSDMVNGMPRKHHPAIAA